MDRAIHEYRAEQRERKRRQEQPEQPDDDNPEMTAEELRTARPAAEVLPELIGPEATAELMRGSQERRWRLFA